MCPARSSCASALGSLVTREPATNQNKGRGQAGSLSRSAGNACQPSRAAPAWAWRWESDSRRPVPSPPPRPHARPSPARGSPNPHRGSRGACAPEPRSRVAHRSLRVDVSVQPASHEAGSEVSLAAAASPAQTRPAAGSRRPHPGGHGRTRGQRAAGAAAHAPGREGRRGCRWATWRAASPAPLVPRARLVCSPAVIIAWESAEALTLRRT